MFNWLYLGLQPANGVACCSQKIGKCIKYMDCSLKIVQLQHYLQNNMHINLVYNWLYLGLQLANGVEGCSQKIVSDVVVKLSAASITTSSYLQVE